MRDILKESYRLQAVLLTILVLVLGFAPGAALAEEAEEEEEAVDSSIDKVVVGVQASGVDGDRGRFDRYRDVPNGFVVDYLRFSHLLGDDKESYFDFEATDPGQNDDRYLLKLGYKDSLRMRFKYVGVPFVFGNDATSVLGDQFRIGNFIQQAMEDPDGNGIPFYLEPDGGAGDNALVQGMTNDLLTGTSLFDVDSKRRMSDLSIAYDLNSAWSFGVDYDTRHIGGRQPLGNGTYQRITDVDGDGDTDYDYFFSVRGVELAAPVEYDTKQTVAWTGVRQENWFGDLRYTYSDFTNDNPFVLYDNPFWFTDTDATSGSRRGLWEESRVSQMPSNKAWNLNLSGGYNFAGNTRLTGMYSTGEHSQNEAFAPITTNTDLIGKMDINGDGVIDERDDPTSTSTLPQSSLNGSVDITVMDLRLSSRPVDWARLNASWRTYKYEGSQSELLIPARAEYNDSHLKDNEKGADLLSIPYFYERENIKVEGVFNVASAFKVAAWWEREGYDWNRYSDSVGGDFTRDAGNRSVSGTDEDTLGVRVLWRGVDWVSGRLDYTTSKRTFNGEHQVAFNGQNEDLRQFDISNRDRDGWNLRFDFLPNDKTSLGVEVVDYQDDYSGLTYGYLDGSQQSLILDGSFVLGETMNLFVYAEKSEAETNTNLRTKCSNCTPPPGAEWTAPWEVPNYDWLTNYQDKTVAFGAELAYHSEDGKNQLTVGIDYLDGQVQQANRNPAPPLDLGEVPPEPVQVALAVDFPDQTNTFASAEVKYTRKYNDLISWGILYIYEKWDLDDFQVDQLEPYGNNFLGVDDATRYLFLDSWYGDYDASIGQFFLKFHF